MLQNIAVESGTLDLLKQIQAIPEFSSFYLVGGTALALKYGHRLSIDLDLFSTKDFEKEALIEILAKQFPHFEYKKDANPVGVFCFIGNVKVDFVKHHYFKLIEAPEIIDGVRMYSDADIAAMKVFAVLKRAKKKDFYDIAELLKKYTIQDFTNFYSKKYPSNMMLISVAQALTYFIDAEADENPVSLNGKTREEVKNEISQAVKKHLS